LFIVFSFCFAKASANENYLSGSRQTAMADCGVAISDLWSVSHNQAGLAYLKTAEIGLYHEQRFVMKELSFSSLAAVIPAKPGTFGLNLNYFGFSKYHESKIGIAYSHKLGEKFAAGIQLDYFTTFIYGSNNNFQKITFELGLLSNPVNNLMVGFHLFNPLPGKSQHNTLQTLPSNTRLGLTYIFHEKVLLAFETSKEFSENIIVKTGIEYIPVKQFAFRFGISTGPSAYSFGLGYKSKKIWAGIAFTEHQVLGITPHIDFGIGF
jgi:hypothetical protein